jgi:hypothetical protein
MAAGAKRKKYYRMREYIRSTDNIKNHQNKKRDKTYQII